MSNIINADITIVGGGIAGLWAANVLKKIGYDVILIEKHSLGNFQTINSQGIIHGGVKYSLVGKLTQTTSNIAKMTTAWDQCLKHKIHHKENLMNLSKTIVNSPCHDLCFHNSGFFKVSSYFTSKILSSNCDIIEKNSPNYQSSLNDLGYNGIVYRVSEQVLNTKSLINNLTTEVKNNIIKIDDYIINYKENSITSISFKEGKDNYTINSKVFVFTSGQSNQNIIDIFKTMPKQQLRPLQMIYARPNQNINLYAHFISKKNINNKPFVTVTTHKNKANHNILYFGGQVAESEYFNTPKELHIDNLKKQIINIFPKAEVENWKWNTVKLNRAEVSQDYNKMPDTSFVLKNNNVIIGWPTKLTFTPDFAEKLILLIKDSKIKPSNSNNFNYKDYNLQTACIAEPCWDNI